MNKVLLYTAIITISAGSSFALANNSGHKGKMFKKMDTNSDGIVTKEEFLAKSEKRFLKMDADKNGKLTKEEIATHRADMKEKWNKKRSKKDKK